MTVAALFVDAAGVYSQIEGVEVWGVDRDARLYAGPHPVVAHPPCERWGRYWRSDGSTRPGEDGGLFESALASVRRWGGVLEHPEASHAWSRFGLGSPTRGGWIRNLDGSWTGEVLQSSYGHRARKSTWLYYVGREPIPFIRETSRAVAYLSQPGRCSATRRRPTCPCSICEETFGDAWRGAHNRGAPRVTQREGAATPLLFAEYLVELARAR